MFKNRISFFILPNVESINLVRSQKSIICFKELGDLTFWDTRILSSCHKVTGLV